ncbi:MAG: rod shape-determining protein MreD [Erythrobacter sp.]
MARSRSRTPSRDRLRSDSYSRTSMRERSGVLAYTIPYASILLGSLLPSLAFSSVMPFLPPMGFIFLLTWRIMRPGLLPMWIGFPLGMFDDLFSGQPFGSAILLWSVTLITIEILEARFPWRGFWQDWFTATIGIVVYITAAMLVSGVLPNIHQLFANLPQLLLSVLLYPIIARMVASLDKLRLKRFKVIS